jgi:hypothetical protein
MTYRQKSLIWIIAFSMGLLANQVYSSTSGKYAELLETKSGTFVVQKGRIYELAELEASIPSINNGAFK